MMAKWNLLTAYNMYQKIKRSKHPALKKLTQKIGLSTKESAEWKRIAARVCINMTKGKIIEQFDGYFKKKRVKITNWDEHSMPIITEKITPRDYRKTQLVKQADVVMLLYLLSDVFSFKTKKQNYEYYIDRTIHKSSLSLPIYALMAIELGDKSRAYRFFNTILHTDISNIHNNTHEGIHAACMGGTWQVLINGFAGVRIQKGILSINPNLPRMWRKILFSLHWRGDLLRFKAESNKISIQLISPNRRRRIKIKVFGVLQELVGNKTFQFERKRILKEQLTYYL